MEVKYRNNVDTVVADVEWADAVLIVQLGESTRCITKAFNYAQTGPHRGAGGIPWRPFLHVTRSDQAGVARSFLAIRHPDRLLVVGATSADDIMKDILF